MKTICKVSRKRRFTLVELLTVMAIIIVLVGLSVAVVGLANSRIAQARTKSLIKKLELAMESYKVKHGYYIPASDTWKAFYVDRPVLNQENFSNLIDYEEMLGGGDIIVSGSGKIVIDAYGNPIEYKTPGTVNLRNKTRFDLLSYGPDGKSPDATKISGSGRVADATANTGADDIKNY